MYGGHAIRSNQPLPGRDAIERRDGPSILIFSRQNLPFQKRDAATIKLIDKGGYILSEAADGKPRAIIIATGSEVGLAMMAQKALAETGDPRARCLHAMHESF